MGTGYLFQFTYCAPDHFSKKKKQLDFRDVYGKYCAVLQESKCARMA